MISRCEQETGLQDAATTLALFFEIVAGAGGGGSDSRGGPQQEQFFLQFITKYLHYDGTFHQRVCTVTRRCVSSACLYEPGWGH